MGRIPQPFKRRENAFIGGWTGGDTMEAHRSAAQYLK
jgi:hypothetical protein